MISFRDKVRRAEIHGFSNVFRKLYADKWDHFFDEINVVKKISNDIQNKFVILKVL